MDLIPSLTKGRRGLPATLLNCGVGAAISQGIKNWRSRHIRTCEVWVMPRNWVCGWASAQGKQTPADSQRSWTSGSGRNRISKAWFCQCWSIRDATPHPMGNRSCWTCTIIFFFYPLVAWIFNDVPFLFGTCLQEVWGPHRLVELWVDFVFSLVHEWGLTWLDMVKRRGGQSTNKEIL